MKYLPSSCMHFQKEIKWTLGIIDLTFKTYISEDIPKFQNMQLVCHFGETWTTITSAYFKAGLKSESEISENLGEFLMS